MPCSYQLSILADRFQASGSDEDRAALTSYIEDALGESLEDAYPTQWAWANAGSPQVLTVDLGGEEVQITLQRYQSGTTAPGSSYTVDVPGLYELDLTLRTIQSEDNVSPWETGSQLLDLDTGLPTNQYNYCHSDDFPEEVFDVSIPGSEFQGYFLTGNWAASAPKGYAMLHKKTTRTTYEMAGAPKVTVPAFPTFPNPIELEVPPVTFAMPEMARTSMHYKFSEVSHNNHRLVQAGPQIQIGFLFRRDTGTFSDSNGSHNFSSYPIDQDTRDDWIFKATNIFPGLADALDASGARTSMEYNADSTPGTFPLPAEDHFEALEAEANTLLQNSNNLKDGNTQSISATNTPGWLCMYWYYDKPTNYFNFGNYFKGHGYNFSGPYLEGPGLWDQVDADWITPPDFTWDARWDGIYNDRGLSEGFGNNPEADGFGDHFPWKNRFQQSYNSHFYDPFVEGVLPYVWDAPWPDAPPYQIQDYVFDHGPWVRIEPGSAQPTYSVRIGDVSCIDDGQPPTVTPSPPLIKPKPTSGACKASIDGPSSCNFNIPMDPDPDAPDFPSPGDFVEPEIPNIPMPEMPVIESEFPLIPPIDCLLPDFGNLTDCPPGPGSGSMPGGRDRKGRRGGGYGGIKTGGPTYGIRDPTFRDTYPDDTIDPDTEEPIIPPTRSFPEGSSVMTAITIILMDLGISPLNIVFEIGPEWDKTFGPKTFSTTMRMFDAAQWLASLIMCKIIDEGDGNVYIGPPMHRPGQNTWTFNSQFPNVDGDPPMLGLGYGASMGEAYYAVKVWGAHLSTPVFALVDTPFSSDPSNILQIEVGPDYSLAEAQDLAAFRAGLIRRDAVMVQVEVPYSQQMFMRDKLVLKFPERGLQWDYIIFAKQSEISAEKQVNILTGVLPATLEELENFPDVMGEGMDAVEMGFA